jgi:hypothetical protein
MNLKGFPIQTRLVIMMKGSLLFVIYSSLEEPRNLEFKKQLIVAYNSTKVKYQATF